MTAAETARRAAPPTGRPVLLDAYCGAGGAARGYQLAGFYVVGVDVAPQPRYAGDEFHRGDAIEFIRRHGREFDVIHSSPPCQHHSRCADMPGRRRADYPDLIDPTRRALIATGRPWVIENVATAPLVGIVLCGQSFGLGVYRHRRFESSATLFGRPHERHRHRISDGRLGRWTTLARGPVITVAGHMFGAADGRLAMGIDWPMTRDELAEAIPPAYSEFVGRQLLRALGRAA
jgi:hypothetical protein